jgi:hypothetical protein
VSPRSDTKRDNSSSTRSINTSPRNMSSQSPGSPSSAKASWIKKETDSPKSSVLNNQSTSFSNGIGKSPIEIGGNNNPSTTAVTFSSQILKTEQLLTPTSKKANVAAGSQTLSSEVAAQDNSNLISGAILPAASQTYLKKASSLSIDEFRNQYNSYCNSWHILHRKGDLFNAAEMRFLLESGLIGPETIVSPVFEGLDFLFVPVSSWFLNPALAFITQGGLPPSYSIELARYMKAVKKYAVTEGPGPNLHNITVEQVQAQTSTLAASLGIQMEGHNNDSNREILHKNLMLLGEGNGTSTETEWSRMDTENSIAPPAPDVPGDSYFSINPPSWRA